MNRKLRALAAAAVMSAAAYVVPAPARADAEVFAPPDLIERLVPAQYLFDPKTGLDAHGHDRLYYIGTLNRYIQRYGVQTTVWCWQDKLHYPDYDCVKRLELLERYGR